MSIKKKLFYSAIEMLLKWVMKKKGGQYGHSKPYHSDDRYQNHQRYGKKPYTRKKGWFD